MTMNDKIRDLKKLQSDINRKAAKMWASLFGKIYK